MTRPLTIRARVAPRPEPPVDRLHDPLIDDLVHGGELSRERFPTRWSDTAALRELAEAKRAPLPRELAGEMLAYHRRLGAGEASLASLARLASGEAVCTVAGQQPAPLGGPLYSLHKTASAVGLSAEVSARTGVPSVPLFWMHGEDSDFAEIRSATIADASLALVDLELPQAAHRDGELVGSIPIAPLEALSRAALEVWPHLSGHADAERLIVRALSHARDLGEAYSALMLELFADQGLVVVDPRLPAFRAAARGIIDRYLAAPAELTDLARRSGAILEDRIGRRPLADSALESFVFAIENGGRRKLSLEEVSRTARSLTLSPSVALRPVVQDGVFPTVAMACGSAEVAYLAQLREVFERLEVRPASPVPRLTATWLPPAAIALLEVSECDVWELTTAADHVLKQLAERAAPAEVREDLERARTDALAGLDRFAASARRVDPSLPQLVESARGKVDYQYARIAEGVTSKMRHQLERQHPEWLRLRYYLMPGDRLQERRLASLEVIAHRGAGAVSEICDLAREQSERLERGSHEHLIVEL